MIWAGEVSEQRMRPKCAEGLHACGTRNSRIGILHIGGRRARRRSTLGRGMANQKWTIALANRKYRSMAESQYSFHKIRESGRKGLGVAQTIQHYSCTNLSWADYMPVKTC